MHAFDKIIRIEGSINPELLVERTVSDACERLAVGEEKFGNILLAVSEAVENAIQHGNAGNPSKHVELSCRGSDSEIIFKVTDEGTGFNPQVVTDPTQPGNSARDGRGLFTMKMLADKVEFRNEEKAVLLSFYLN